MKYEWTPIVMFCALVAGGGWLIGPFIDWCRLGETPWDIAKAHELETLMIHIASFIVLTGLGIGLLLDWCAHEDEKGKRL